MRRLQIGCAYALRLVHVTQSIVYHRCNELQKLNAQAEGEMQRVQIDIRQTLRITAELIIKSSHHVLLVLCTRQCTNTNSISKSILNDHVSEPYNITDFTAATQNRIWSITGCYADATDALNWKIPIRHSVCKKTLHPMWDHSTTWTCPDDKTYLLHRDLALWEHGSSLGQSSSATAFCTLKV